MTDPRHQLGRLGEELAAEHLVRRGFEIIERNYRTRWGELDIVAFDGRTIAFCEVKSRRSRTGAPHRPDPEAPHRPDREAPHRPDPLGPFASVHPQKQAQVRKMAIQWLSDRSDRRYAPALRFDAIGVWVDEDGALVRLEHLEGAF